MLSFASRVAHQRLSRRSLVKDHKSDEASSVRYFFLRADMLRDDSEHSTLPALQTMKRDDTLCGWLVEKEMNFDDACRGEYLQDYMAVSHRWLDRNHPDPEGVQLEAIKNCLRAPEAAAIKYVWVDWMCMWQGDKEGQRDITEAERSDFKTMLSEVNLLYLGCQVLVLLDLSYGSRFWTGYEAWLSMRAPGADGLVGATEQTQRSRIVPIMTADETDTASLQAKWLNTSAAKAMEKLARRDISVTNQSDKDDQLARLKGLEDRVKRLFSRDSAMQLVEVAMRAEPIDLPKLTAAIDRAAKVGVSETRLVPARSTVSAVSRLPRPQGQAAPAESQEEVLRARVAQLECELQELRALDVTGLSCAQAKAAGVTALQARVAGYALADMRKGGYACIEAS